MTTPASVEPSGSVSDQFPCASVVVDSVPVGDREAGHRNERRQGQVRSVVVDDPVLGHGLLRRRLLVAGIAGRLGRRRSDLLLLLLHATRSVRFVASDTTDARMTGPLWPPGLCIRW